MRKAGNGSRINKQGEEAHSSVTPRSLCIYTAASLFSLNDAIPRVAVSDDESQAIETQLNSDWIVSQTTESLTRWTIRILAFSEALVKLLFLKGLSLSFGNTERTHPEW